MKTDRGVGVAVRSELADAMRRQAPTNALGVASMALCLAWVIRNDVERGTLLVWLGTVLALIAAQMAVRFTFFSSARAADGRLNLWPRFYLVSVLLVGVAWATVPFLFLKPGEPMSNLYVISALVGFGGFAMPALMLHTPSLVTFLALLLISQAARLLTLEGENNVVIAIGSLILLVFFVSLGRIQSRITRESIRLRHENVDLVARLQLEQAVTQSALAVAESANKSKSQFFAAASHDLRQPLHALALFSASLRELNPEPEKRQVVDQVYASIEALEELFDEVLDLSKLDAGYVEANRSHFRIARLLDALRLQFMPVAIQAGLTLHVVASRATVFTDATLLSRILSNLVSNAIRYTPTGRVTLGCRLRGEILRIEVHDTGIGIPADEQERVFDEFVQLGNPERDRRKGLGLGLTSVRRLSQLLGHPLTLESASGRGTSFRLEVPMGDPLKVMAIVASTQRADLLAGKRIVVVDDELAIREAMHDLLSRWGCHAVTAIDGAQAIALLEASGPPDLIISDYRLAGPTTGAGVIELLRTRYGAGVPAMLITADTSPERLRETRATGHLLQHKPVRPAQLRAACNQLLAVSRTRSEP